LTAGNEINRYRALKWLTEETFHDEGTESGGIEIADRSSIKLNTMGSAKLKLRCEIGMNESDTLHVEMQRAPKEEHIHDAANLPDV